MSEEIEDTLIIIIITLKPWELLQKPFTSLLLMWIVLLEFINETALQKQVRMSVWDARFRSAIAFYLRAIIDCKLEKIITNWSRWEETN